MYLIVSAWRDTKTIYFNVNYGLVYLLLNISSMKIPKEPAVAYSLFLKRVSMYSSIIVFQQKHNLETHSIVTS
jgi:hypothetical protein